MTDTILSVAEQISPLLGAFIPEDYRGVTLWVLGGVFLLIRYLKKKK